MSTTLAAVTIISGLAFIAVSIWLRFAKKLRVIVGVAVGICIGGLALSHIRSGTQSAAGWIGQRIAAWVGEDGTATAGAIVCGTALVLALIVFTYLRGGGGHGGGGRRGFGHGHGGHSSGGGGRVHPHLALAAALAAPMLIPVAVEILGTVK